MRETSPVHLSDHSRRIGAWTNVLAAMLVLGLLGMLGRVAWLKVTPDARLVAAAGSAESHRRDLARRGELLDREGRVIATSAAAFRLYIDPSEVADVSTIAVDLAAILDEDPITLDRRIQPRIHTQYARVIDVLTDRQVEAIRGARLDGVGLEPCLERHYPHGDVAAGIVGMVGFDHTGLGGLEHVFDERMRPTAGRLTYLRDVRRRAMWIEADDYLPAAHGRDVRLSLDLVLQAMVEQRLQAAVTQHRAAGGRVIVIDPLTGEILAMADVINPDPHAEPLALDPARRRDPALGRNRCATDPYEPGSTFKPFIWAAALEDGKVTLTETLNCPESGPHVTSFGRRIRDSFPKGPSDWEHVLIHSLNSGMAIVAERMSHARMQEVLSRFGFGRRTRCGLPGETAGLVTPPAKWSAYTQTSVSFGHEIAVTPLQMVRAFAAFARDGTVPTLRLTAVQPEESDYRLLHRVLPESIALATRRAMRRVMEEGSGRRCLSERYHLFGKSGTPQLPKAAGGGYHEDRYLPSFIAGAPYENPRVVVLCVIEDPDKATGHFGGQVAGPVVRDIIDATLAYLGVPEEKEEVMSDGESRDEETERSEIGDAW
ncbi:MAG: peptidoglycan D,D-transpeptidase FtsI family protein [Planctomycetota bacterium]